MNRVLATVAVAVALLAGCGCSGASKPKSVTPTPTGRASAVATATTTAIPEAPSPTAAAAATSTPGAPRVQVTGLFSGAPPAGSQPLATTRTLGPRPASPFAAWDGTRAVIYDTKTSAEIDLGPATGVVFSPDSTVAGWIPASGPGGPGPATVLDLATGARRTYGEASNMAFPDNRRLAIYDSQSSAWRAIDLDSGQPSADQSLFPDHIWQLHRAPNGLAAAGYYFQVTRDESTLLNRGGAGKSHFRMIELASGATALEFDAVFAGPAGPGEIVLGTPLDSVMTNIFVVNIQTGRAEFIARARYGRGPNWPLSATDRYVMWAENFCWMEGVDPPRGQMQLYDRATKTLTDIADGVPPESLEHESLRYGKVKPGGLIALGSFGARALVDPATLSYTAVLPGSAWPSFVSWSPDYRYAAYAPGGGHGGLC